MQIKINYSLIIPAYNEIGNLPNLIKKCDLLIKQKPNLEVIIVNNGSTDGTMSYLSKELSSNTSLRSINIKKNLGYGWGVLSGLKQAKGDVLGWSHADLQTDLSDFIKAINIYEKLSIKDDIYLKGKRINRPIKDKLFTIGMTLFEYILLGVWMEEINAQPNLFHKNFLSQWEDPPKDFSLDLYVFYKAKQLKMKFIKFEVNFDKRTSGLGSNETLIQKIKYSLDTIKFSLKLKSELISGRKRS